MRILGWIVGVVVILTAVITCFAIPEMPLTVFTALFLLIFGLICLPPIRERVAFLRSRAVTIVILVVSTVGVMASLVIADSHGSYNLAADTNIAAKECNLATIKKNHRGDKLPLDSLIEATQYGFASLAMTRASGDAYEKIQDAMNPIGMNVAEIGDHADAIVEQCHARFPNTGTREVHFPDSNFKTMLLCHDLPRFLAMETEEVDVIPEDKDRVARMMALADKIQPKIRADMSFGDGGDTVRVDGGKTQIDPETLKSMVVLDASTNSNFAALADACVAKFS